MWQYWRVFWTNTHKSYFRSPLAATGRMQPGWYCKLCVSIKHVFVTVLQVEKVQLTASVHKEQSTRIHEEYWSGEHWASGTNWVLHWGNSGGFSILICVSLGFPTLNVLISYILFSYNNRNQFHSHCVFNVKIIG